MKKVIYAGMILMLGTLATSANPISKFKPYEKDNTEQDVPEASQDNQNENNVASQEYDGSPVKDQGIHE